MKKISLVIFTIFILVSSFFFLIIPFGEISKLSSGFIRYTIDEEGVDYVHTKKRPKTWVSLNQISKKATWAIIVSEDGRFYEHKGYDTEEIKEALEDTLKSGKKLRGASTISQQLTKNLFFNSKRSFLRKFNELLVTMYLENRLSKERILEIYLNIIEFGENLYGIKEASSYYFNKSPISLSAKEGAFLAMLLPSPKRYAESFRQKKLTPYAKKIVSRIIWRMVRSQYISKSEGRRELSRRLNFEELTPKEQLENLLEKIKIFDESEN